MATFINFGTKECPKLVNEERIISIDCSPKGRWSAECYTIRYGFTSYDTAKIIIWERDNEASFKKSQRVGRLQVRLNTGLIFCLIVIPPQFPLR